MPSHADTHDLDKLRRWQKDLEATPDDAPAVYAIFLVSEADTAAHDIFRAFRASFEEWKAGFAHLVIFGQHGVSTTVRAMQGNLGLAEDGLPTLVMFGGDTGDVPEFVRLPGGASGDAEGDGWQEALARAEGVMDESLGGSGAAEFNRVVKHQLTSLCAAVVDVVER